MPARGLLILVQGLAGSGKSHLIELLRYDFLIEEDFAADEVCEAKNISTLAQELSTGHRCVISERKYRTSHEREAFIAAVQSRVRAAPMPHIVSICFDNDLDSANHNCQQRTNKAGDPCGSAHIRQNHHDTADYEIPSDAIVVRVHRIPVKN